MKNKLLLFSIFIFLGPLISYAICPGDTARFSSNAPKCKSDSVKFTDASKIAPGDAISSYLWNFGDTGLNNTSTLKNPSHLFSAGGTFSVKLITFYLSGCKDTTTVGIGIQSVVVVSGGPDINSCKNNLTVNLVGTHLNTGGASWHGSGIISPLNSETPIYTPTAAAKASGTDTVILRSYSPAFCPNVSDTVVIFFSPGPIVNAGPNLSVCKDTSGIPVFATITNATGGTWHTLGTGGSFVNVTNAGTIYIPSASDTAAGSVILYRESTGNGICLPARDSLTVTFTPTPTVVIKTNDSACSRSPIILDVTVSTGAGFWSSSGTGTFTPNNTGLNGFYNPSAADDLLGKVTLKFTSTNNGGCHSSFDTLLVIIKTSPTAAYTSIMACAQKPVNFTDASMPAGTIVSWTWGFDDLSPNGALQNPSHTYIAGGPYNVSLIVKSNNGCKDTVTQLINVYRIPVANYTASGICMNTGTLFTNTTTIVGATLTSSFWNFGDLTTSNLTSPTHFFSSSASFPVKLVVQSSQGCFDSITQTIPIQVGPTALFTISDATAIINQPITFTDQSASSISLSWNFGDSSARDTLSHHPSHNYSIGGFYNVCLTVTDASGCKDTTCQQETVSTHPSRPTAFSPNGDGQNDVFYVYGGPFKTLDFRIYNNWGELVFQSNNQSDGWDGKRNGVDQPMGVYVYTFVGTTADDFEYKASGDVTLLR